MDFFVVLLHDMTPFSGYSPFENISPTDGVLVFERVVECCCAGLITAAECLHVEKMDPILEGVPHIRRDEELLKVIEEFMERFCYYVAHRMTLIEVQGGFLVCFATRDTGRHRRWWSQFCF